MREEDICKAWDGISENEEMYEHLKSGVEKKRKKAIRKRLVTLCSICLVFFLANATIYAFSDSYKAWFSSWLGVGQEKVQKITGQDEDNGVMLETKSYYMIDNTVYLLVSLGQTNGEKWSEEWNMGNVGFSTESGEKQDGSLLYFDTFFSENSKELLGVVVASFDKGRFDNQKTLWVENLISKVDGTIQCSGQWQIPVMFDEEKSMAAESVKIPDIAVSLRENRYILKELCIADRIIFFKAEAQPRECPIEEQLSAYYGIPADIWCKDGHKLTDLTCIPDGSGNLFLFLDESLEFAEIEQIYLNDKGVIYLRNPAIYSKPLATKIK